MNTEETWGLILFGGIILLLLRGRDQSDNPGHSKGNSNETLAINKVGLWLVDMGWAGKTGFDPKKKESKQKIRWDIFSQDGKAEGYLTFDKPSKTFDTSKMRSTPPSGRKWAKKHLKDYGYKVK